MRKMSHFESVSGSETSWRWCITVCNEFCNFHIERMEEGAALQRERRALRGNERRDR